MKSEEYVKNAVKTEATDYDKIRGQFADSNIRLLHGMIGLCTETGELQDALKKHIFYGKQLDKVNVKEEIGDLFWYIALLCDELGVSFEELWEQNIAKLKARYGDKFTEEGATNRDLEKERKILEGDN